MSRAPVSPRRAVCGHVAWRPPAAASLLCLTSMKGVQRTGQQAWPLAPSPLAATSAHPAPWTRPSQPAPSRGWWASWPRPPWGLREAGAARQGAQERRVPRGLLPCLCGLHCVFLTGPWVQLSGPACLHSCLSEFGAVSQSGSCCLAAWGLSGSTFPSLCLSARGLGSPHVASDTQCWLAQPQGHVHIPPSVCGLGSLPGYLEPADEPAGNR